MRSTVGIPVLQGREDVNGLHTGNRDTHGMSGRVSRRLESVRPGPFRPPRAGHYSGLPAGPPPKS